MEALEHASGDDVDAVALKVFGAVLILASIGIVLRGVGRAHSTGDHAFVLANRDRLRGLLVGVLGGFVVGMTSVGSGTFLALMLIVLFPLTAPGWLEPTFSMPRSCCGLPASPTWSGQRGPRRNGVAHTRGDTRGPRRQPAHRAPSRAWDPSRAGDRAARVGNEARGGVLSSPSCRSPAQRNVESAGARGRDGPRKA